MKAGAVAVTVLAQARAAELATVCSLARIGHALCDARSCGTWRRRTPRGCGSRRSAGTGPMT